MNDDEIARRLDASVDRLAAIEHERWVHWQRYMHERGERLADGRLVLPSDEVARWDRQIATPFDKLTEEEKDSDRNQVRRYYPEILAIFSDR